MPYIVALLLLLEVCIAHHTIHYVLLLLGCSVLTKSIGQSLILECSKMPRKICSEQLGRLDFEHQYDRISDCLW